MSVAMDNLTRQKIYMALIKSTPSDRAAYGLDNIYDHNRNKDYLLNIFPLAWQVALTSTKLFPVPMVVKAIILAFEAKYSKYLEENKDSENPKSHALALLSNEIIAQLESGADQFENIALLRRRVKV